MRAAVVHHIDLTVAMTRRKNGLMPDFRGYEIAGVGQLAGMADIDPAVREKLFHLQLEDLFINVCVAMNSVAFDQTGDGLTVSSVAIHGFLLFPVQMSMTSLGDFDRDTQICIN